MRLQDFAPHSKGFKFSKRSFKCGSPTAKMTDTSPEDKMGAPTGAPNVSAVPRQTADLLVSTKQ